MITGIPFEIARDIAYFELHKQLTRLTEEDPTGSPETKTKAFTHLRAYETRSRQIKDYGIERTELQAILDDFKVNPISRTSAMNEEKHAYMITEMELLLADNYDRNGFVIRLIEAYGYETDKAKQLQEVMLQVVREKGKLVSFFDFVNEHLKGLKEHEIN